jgi:hypothetical protein
MNGRWKLSFDLGVSLIINAVLVGVAWGMLSAGQSATRKEVEHLRIVIEQNVRTRSEGDVEIRRIDDKFLEVERRLLKLESR